MDMAMITTDVKIGSCRLILGDCREILPMLQEGFADMICCDPPYGDTSLEWDSIVAGWLPAVARALKPNGSLWVFGSMRFLAPLFAEAEALGFKYSQDVVWRKQNGTGFHADRFRRVHEHAVLFYRGRWQDVYHDTQYTADATARTVRRKQRAQHWGDIDAGHYVSEDGGPRMMQSVLEVRNEHGRAIHPTQKPVELLRPLIRYSCPPGGVVLDPFFGSASSGEASMLEARGFVGIENDPIYFGCGTDRLDLVLNPIQASLL
jgi:site-specific DNA-methyltransferase (adenine-specific)